MNINLIDFSKMFKERIGEAIEDKLDEIIEPLPIHDEVLEEHVPSDAPDIDWTEISGEERDALLKIKETARHLGGDQGAYVPGIFTVTFKNKDAVKHYAEALDEFDEVDDYEVEARREVMVDGHMDDKEYDIDDVMFDKDFEFIMTVYLVPEIVSYPAWDEDVTDAERETYADDKNLTIITEVRRRFKVNFRGKRRIKMQCRPGFKWDAKKRACLKITGSEVAQMRRRHRRAVRTKKAKGAGFKVRMLRKTRRARRFRKSMGLKN